MEKTGKWSEISLINIEFRTNVKDEKILSSKEAVVLVMRVGMHAEGSVPQASIVERKSKDEDDLWSHKLRLKSPIITSSHE